LLTGGVLRPGELSLVGDLAERSFQDLMFDTFVMGGGGIDPAVGCTEFNLDDARVKRAALANARRCVVVADGSKLGRVAFARICPLERVDVLVTDTSVPVDAVEADLATLLAAEFDAVMFCNEGDRPYALTAGPEGVAAMTRVVAELAPRDRPFGVDFLWDARAALAIAVATGASFIREVATGAYESDMGIWNTNAA